MTSRSVDLWTETLPPEYHWDPLDPRRGTEEFYVRTAESLVDRGHDVTVLYDGSRVVHNGVVYCPRVEYASRYDITIYCNDPEGATPVSGARLIRWTNKYGDRPSTIGRFHSRVVISQFQKSIYGDAVVIGHGCDPIEPKPKLNQALYSSSPDRGLDFLKAIWPRVQAATGVELVHTTGTDSNDSVKDLYASARFWLHPGLGVELFCLSALKAQAAGCIPCVVPHMALAETVKYGLKTSLDRFERDLIAYFLSDPQPEPFVAPTWQSVTEQLEALF